MDVSDGSLSDSKEGEGSQATQLIYAALEQSSESPENRSRSAVVQPDKDVSNDSYPSPKNSNAEHQYHFHGLAATQTETQSYDDKNSASRGMMPTEGSQKENYSCGKDVKWGMPSPDSQSSSPHDLAVKNIMKVDGLSGQDSGRVTKSLLKSPLPSSTVHNRMGRHSTKSLGNLHVPPQTSRQNPRSPSPDLSQDSFAQGDSQLSEENFLMTSKKLNMPLADLARGADLSGEYEPSRESSTRSQTAQPGPSSGTIIRVQYDHPPVILVPATPSESGSEDGSREEQFRGGAPSLLQAGDSSEKGRGTRIMLDSDSSKSSQHSQGFDGQDEVAEVQDLYSNQPRGNQESGHPHTSSNIQGMSTASSQQATQIATQDEHDVSMQAGSSVIPQTHSSTYTGPRSLLDSMNPHKRNRYQHLFRYTPASPISPQPQQFPAGHVKLSERWEETQLPEPPQSKSALRVPPSNTVVSPRKASPKKSVHRLPLLSGDNMDTVPDSEPLREPAASSEAAEQHSLNVGKLPLPQKGGQLVEGSSHGSEATEDSDIPPPMQAARREEEEEEEEEEEGKGKEKEEGLNLKGEDDRDDIDDDDDVPLSVRLYKGKGKATATNDRGHVSLNPYAKADKKRVVARSVAATKLVQEPSPQKGRQAPNSRKLPATNLSHESFVPSSVPEQDHARPLRSQIPSLKAIAILNNKNGQSIRQTCTRATPVVKSTRSHRSATVEAEENLDVEMEEISDSERATEPAMEEEEAEEDEDEEDEAYMEPEMAQQTLKRKRGRPPKSKSLNHATTTPRTRNTKRLKPAGSTMSRMDATRVFALWKQNNLWYSGIVQELIAGTTYSIKFDDGFENAVNTDNMRTFNLRIGDLVRINKKAKDYKVVKINHRTMTANVDIGGAVEEYHIRDISISTKIINSMWQDRTIDSRAIVPLTREADVKPTPSPTRSAASLHSLSVKGSRPPNKFLQKVGLVVSLSGNNTNDKTKDGRSRSDILNAVRDSGGVVVDDLFKYLKMDISYFPNRCLIEDKDVEWVGEAKELQRLFLLADDCNLKPKYLMALALGIPCLSISWLYACLEAGKELDWRPHLLPQGRPTSFDVLPSQQIDLSWGSCLDHLFSIMSNPLAPKILAGKSVLCVGPDMTPKGKDTDKTSEAANYIIRIIVATGATRVEAVRDAIYAVNPLSQYDLLVIREKEQYIRARYMQTYTVDWNWVKDSLIMSRMLPYPSWAVEDDSQCSQSL